MSHPVPSTTASRVPRALLLGTFATSLLLPASAPAFFQQTKLEGSVGSDIGGVWLSVQQIMPEFRVSFQKPPAPATAVPLEVGAIPAELEPVTGKNPQGVVITKCVEPGFCSSYGLVEGDIVTKINVTEIKDVASFEAAALDPPPTVMLSIRRPSLRMTTARLLKMKYTTTGKETAEGSEQQETLDVQVLDVKLPFHPALEETRNTHETFQPTEAQLAELGSGWARLPLNNPLLLFKGSHRFVAQSNFDEALANDRSLTKAKFALVMDMEGNPMSGRGGGKVVDIYGIESMEPKRIEGNYVTVTIAAAPFPINIEFKGRFVMTRIADWSDEDDKLRLETQRTQPKEDLSKYKTTPDVPESVKKPAETK